MSEGDSGAGACAVLALSTLFPAPSAPLSTQLYSLAPAERSGQLLRMDRLSGLALCAADRVLFDPAAAGRFCPETTALVLGSAYGCHQCDEEYFRGLLAGTPSPRLFAYTLPSSAVGEVSIHHGLRGAGLSLVGDRSAGLQALSEAQALLASGQAGACLVLGCEIAAPLYPQQAEDAQLLDGAVAILLSPAALVSADLPKGYLVGSAEAYCPGDPAAALHLALAELRARHPTAESAAAVCDPQTAVYFPPALFPVRIHPVPACGAAAPLAVFAALPELAQATGTGSYLLVSADPCGNVGAVLWHRSRTHF